MMMDLEIEAIRARANAATEGPWEWHRNGKRWLLWGNHGMRPIVFDYFQGMLRLRDFAKCLMIPFTREHPDAVFISKAREDVVFLLQALDSWRKNSDEWQKRACDAEWNLAKGVAVENELLKTEKERITHERDQAMKEARLAQDAEARMVEALEAERAKHCVCTEEKAFQQFKREGVNE